MIKFKEETKFTNYNPDVVFNKSLQEIENEVKKLNRDLKKLDQNIDKLKKV